MRYLPLLLVLGLGCHRDLTQTQSGNAARPGPPRPVVVARRALGLYVGSSDEPGPGARSTAIGRLYYINSDSGVGRMLAMRHTIALCGLHVDSSGQLSFQVAGKYAPAFVGWVTPDSITGRLADRNLVLQPLGSSALADPTSGLYGSARLGESGDINGWSALIVRSGDSALVLYADDEGVWGQPQPAVPARLDGRTVRFIIAGRSRAVDLDMKADSAHPDVQRISLRDLLVSSPIATCDER